MSPKSRKSRRKHRWKLVSEEVVDSSKLVRSAWECRRCGFDVVVWDGRQPSGSLLDRDGLGCGSRIVASVMSS